MKQFVLDIYIYIYCTYHNYHDTNAFCSMWLSSIVTLVLNSAHGTRTTCIDDNRKHQSCRRWWCRVTLHVVAYNVLTVTETVTVVIVQSTTMKQSYSHSVIWRLTVSVHPFPSIHWLTFTVHDATATLPFSFHEAELRYFPIHIIILSKISTV